MYVLYKYTHTFSLYIYNITVTVWLETDDMRLVIMLYMLRKLALVRVKYSGSITLDIVY